MTIRLASAAACSIAMAMLSTLVHADPVAERGLVHATTGIALLAKSVSRVNALVREDGPHLAVYQGNSGSATGEALVYLVESRSDSILTPASVPSGCRCVFVSPSTLRVWVKRNSTGAGRMDLDEGNVLVFMLLHEVGHLKQGTAGASIERGVMSQLNVEPSRMKVREEEADDFAADILKRRARGEKPGDLSIDANWVMGELAKMSWNMQAFRTLDEFGAFAVGKPSVYFDNGYTHPNLAWRILRVNDLIQQSQATRDLLDSFEDARRRGGKDKPP